MDNKISVDTYKWLKSLPADEIGILLLNVKFENLKTVEDKINSLKNWFKPNNKITKTDIILIRKWINDQLTFKRTKQSIISLQIVFGKDKTVQILRCSKEYFDKWINARSFNSIEYKYTVDEKQIDIKESTKIVFNTMQNIIDNKAIELFKEII